MSNRANARNARSEWWVESKGYEREQTLAQKRRETKAKLPTVLEYFGLDYEGVEKSPGFFFRKVACPFHDDRHPSASVSATYFKCFACGVHGDAVALVMDQLHMGYEEAVEWVAKL